MPSRSNLRLTEVIRQRAAHVILYELRDPRMGFVTITKVKLAPDLSTCVIFWSVMGGDGEKSKTRHALDHARLFIQRRVAEGLKTRTAPILSFEFDPSVEGAIKMGGLLKSLRDERGEAAPPAADAAPAADTDADEPSTDEEEASEDEGGVEDADAADEEAGDAEGEETDGEEPGDPPPGARS